MSKLFIIIFVSLVLLLVAYSPNIIRLYKLANLYNEKTIAKNFINIDKIFNNISNPIPSSENPIIFKKKEFYLPETYTYEGKKLNLQEGISHFHTDGLIVLHDGKMLFEQYWNE